MKQLNEDVRSEKAEIETASARASHHARRINLKMPTPVDRIPSARLPASSKSGHVASPLSYPTSSFPFLHTSSIVLHNSNPATMEWLTLFALPITVVVAWLYTVSIAKTRFPKLVNKRICLLIAHPDDEAMFFAPTLLALTAPSLGNHVKILCLSSGTSFILLVYFASASKN